mgnify:CR=1 FL=1
MTKEQVQNKVNWIAATRHSAARTACIAEIQIEIDRLRRFANPKHGIVNQCVNAYCDAAQIALNGAVMQ